MKITLHNPPEGFEAEAEIRKPNKGDKFLGWDIRLDTASRDFQTDHHIVLTPKKRKYWRLDPVATFEEASPSFGKNKDLRYGLYKDKAFGDWYEGEGIKWLKLTECEEQW